MAIYHFHAGVISRATSPRTTCAASAYIGGLRIACGRDGRVHDYTHRHDVVAGGVVLPDGASAGLSEPSVLWNEIETSVERGGRAQLAREMDAAIPVELGRDARVALARGYAESLSREYGVPVQWAVHDKLGNPHVHLLAPLRSIDPDTGRWMPKSVNAYLVRDANGNEREATAAELKQLGPGWQKVYRYKGGADQLTKAEAEAVGLHPTRDRTSKSPVQTTRYLSPWSGNWGDGDRGAELTRWRERWAAACNESLERAGSDARVDHRSNRERGIELLPTVHLGPNVTATEKKAKAEAKASGEEYVPVTERARTNETIRRINELLRELIRIMNELIRTRREKAKTLEGKRRAQRAAARRRPRRKTPYAPQRGRKVSPRGGYGR